MLHLQFMRDSEFETVPVRFFVSLSSSLPSDQARAISSDCSCNNWTSPSGQNCLLLLLLLQAIHPASLQSIRSNSDVQDKESLFALPLSP